MNFLLDYKVSKDTFLISAILIFWLLSGIRPFALGFHKKNSNWKKADKLEKINLVAKSIIQGPFFKI